MRTVSGQRLVRWLMLGFVVGSIGFLSAGCDSQSVLCTAEFVTYTVRVVTPAGQPADSVQIEVRNASTGARYDVCGGLSPCHNPEDGQYTIFHDGVDVGPFPTEVVVTGRKGDLGFRATYVFRQGQCHVRKLAGPAQVTLSR
ncbi:hypothetical protein [Salisaeta longa]|uniref:hypothetical protein n=1 Tax=Salisaeta longa TaxID=503170 RepID=UPI000424C304|nr:hypothetical protein [Salisaeta longa]